MFKKKSPPEERRQYLRLNSVFPVEFQILGVDSFFAHKNYNPLMLNEAVINEK